jgi:hypothetical protein
MKRYWDALVDGADRIPAATTKRILDLEAENQRLRKRLADQRICLELLRVAAKRNLGQPD